MEKAFSNAGPFALENAHSAAVYGLAQVIALALLASGLWYFRKTERSFADVI